MLELSVCKDKNEVFEFCKKAGLENSCNILCLKATEKEKCLGFSLFNIRDNSITLQYIEPTDDIALADGILRSTLHVGTERNVSDAFYGKSVDEAFLKKIDFLENSREKRLKLQNLFTDCCNCKK